MPWLAVIGHLLLVLLAVTVGNWFFNPLPPVEAEAAFRRDATALIETGQLPVDVEWQVEEWRYHWPFLYYIIPIQGAWTRSSTITVRSTTTPGFVVETPIQFTKADSSQGVHTTNLQDALKWKSTVEALPQQRQTAFLEWWSEQVRARELQFVVRRIEGSDDPAAQYGAPPEWPEEGAWPTADTGFPAPRPSLPTGVALEDVYVAGLTSLTEFNGVMIGWLEPEARWIVLDRTP